MKSHERVKRSLGFHVNPSCLSFRHLRPLSTVTFCQLSLWQVPLLLSYWHFVRPLVHAFSTTPLCRAIVDPLYSTFRRSRRKLSHLLSCLWWVARYSILLIFIWCLVVDLVPHACLLIVDSQWDLRRPLELFLSLSASAEVSQLNYRLYMGTPSTMER